MVVVNDVHMYVIVFCQFSDSIDVPAFREFDVAPAIDPLPNVISILGQAGPKCIRCTAIIAPPTREISILATDDHGMRLGRFFRPIVF